VRDVKLQLIEEEIKAEVEKLRKEWTEGKHQFEEVASDSMELVGRGKEGGREGGREGGMERREGGVEKERLHKNQARNPDDG